MRLCSVCGKPLTGKLSVYCSPECRAVMRCGAHGFNQRRAHTGVFVQMATCCICGKELTSGEYCSSRRCVEQYQREHITALKGKSLREAALEVARAQHRLTLREQAEARLQAVQGDAA